MAGEYLDVYKRQPNVNPVELGHVEASRTPDGKIDPTKIVDPAVAGDWEEQGCKG